MQVISNETIVFCDVDDTLVMWNSDLRDVADPENLVHIRDPYDDEKNVQLVKNLGNIKILKDRKKRGAHIVVWSAGGFEWAQVVVQALGLENYVDMVMSKPLGYIDDKKAEDILGERIYVQYGSGYGE